MAKVITEAQKEKAITAIRTGAPVWLAAQFAGIDRKTLSTLRKNDEAFNARIEEAEGAAAMYFIAQLRKHAESDARVAQFWLERRMRNDFGHKVEITEERRVFTINMGNPPKEIEDGPDSLPEPSDVIEAEATELDP